MGVNLGSTAISDLRLGDTQVSKAYLGTDLVWDSSPAPTIRALKFTSAGEQTLGIDQSALSTLRPNFEYSNDGETWNTWDIATSLSFGNGTDLYIRGMNNLLATSSRNTTFVFSTSEPVTCSGNIMHLFDYTQDLTAFPTAESSAGTYSMFRNCTQLVSAPQLPATILPERAYYGMFQGCTSLLEVPALPATTVGTDTYGFMFDGCTALTRANRISALALPDRACEYMFNGCTSLVTAPALPALSLGPNACAHMFQGCTSLVTIPALPATALGTSCYQYMFTSCPKIKMATSQSDDYPNEFIFGTNPAGYCNRMFRNTGGTYVGNPDQTTYYTANTIIS
jgi:hypothetical protein